MKSKMFAIVTLFLAAVFSVSAITIKIGTVAPTGSPWDQILHRIAGKWDQASNGRIHVIIYAGGIAGGESDMIRKMRIGQLQGAALTQLGLGQIVPDLLALDVPFLIQTNGEFSYLLSKTRGYFDKRFDNAGYQLMTWSSAGWVRFFTTQPVSSPQDLKKLKLGVPAGNDQLLNAWRNLGFNAISLPIPDIMTGLQSGMIDAFYAPPSAAVVYEWFRGALYMSAFRVTPVIVGLVIDNRAWQMIPKEIRPKLRAAMKGIEAALNRASVSMDAQAIAAMKKHGLQIDPSTSQTEKEWHALGIKGTKLVAGNLVSNASINLVKNYLEQYNASHAGSP